MDPTINSMQEEIKKGTIPAIGIRAYITNKEHSNKEPETYLLLIAPKFSFLGRQLGSLDSIIIGQAFGNSCQVEFNIEIPFPRWRIEAIEAERVDDVLLSLNLELLYSFTTGGHTHFSRRNIHYEMKYSQREWTEKLKEMGYSESWIIEILRPNIEGMDTVIEHLRKAADCLSTRDYDNCLANTRIAWDSFKPFLESKWEGIEKLIDEGSPGQKDRESKAERIKSIKDKIRNFTHVGIHREAYKVFPDDAFLSYHLTVSMISYLSKWLSKVTRETPT